MIISAISCSKEKLYSDLDHLKGEGVIQIGTNNVDGVIGEIFSKYSYVTAPNGGRVIILGTSGVTEEQMLYAKDILKQYLTIKGEVYGTKKYVANSMANKRCAIVFWDSEQQYEDNISRVSMIGYNVQDLYATESIGSSNRDASYEEILHLVHNYGIAPTAPLFQEALQKANDDAMNSGLWSPWSNDLPKADFEDEYFAALMDCYLGLWKHHNSTMDGAYKPSSKEEMKQQDPVGYKLIRDMFGDIAPVR
jgi:hypothetical protein